MKLTNRRRKHVLAMMGLASVLALSGPTSAEPRLRMVTNMTPKASSAERNQDAEASIAINPRNPERMASGITGLLKSGWWCQRRQPILRSRDYGLTWELKCPIGDTPAPSAADITVTFGSDKRLWVADMYFQAPAFNTTATRLSKVSNVGKQLLPARSSWIHTWRAGGGGARTSNLDLDQPFVLFDWLPGVAGPGESLVVVPANEPGGANVAEVHPGANAQLFDTTVSNNDLPAVRAAIHPSGRVYTSFTRETGSAPLAMNCAPDPAHPAAWADPSGQLITADFTVVRDDHWAGGTQLRAAPPPPNLPDFQALGAGGSVVAAGITLPFASSDCGTAAVGKQRTGDWQAIAADPQPAPPNQGDTLFVAWVDGPAPNALQLHLRYSLNGGQAIPPAGPAPGHPAWSADLITIPMAVNPSIAINDNSTVALLYQRYDAGNTRWVTEVRTFHMIPPGAPGGNPHYSTYIPVAPTPPGVPHPDTKGGLIRLAQTSAALMPDYQPYLGDYAHIIPAGTFFAGVFTANNDLSGTFPCRTDPACVFRYNRVTLNAAGIRQPADAPGNVLGNLSNTPLPGGGASIDPFFFVIEDVIP